MKTYTNDHGLFVDPSTDPPTCCGYIFNFPGHGAFSPDGKLPATPEEIQEHNRLLANAEWTAMLKHGRGTLYLTIKDGAWSASDWPGINRVPVLAQRRSFHNFTGKNGRTDVWFRLDGSEWHGINIGDNQILRVKRNKGGSRP